MVPVGDKLAIGVEESRGEVITFLEDNHMRVTQMLQGVESAFREARSLVHFHNG